MSEFGTALIQLAKAIRDNTTGIRGIPDSPPAQANDFPFLVIYPNTGIQEWRTYPERWDTHNPVIELHIALKNLPTDVISAVSFIESIPAAIKTAEQAGNLSAIDVINGPMEYTFGEMAWGEIETIGFRWVLSGVRIHHTS